MTLKTTGLECTGGAEVKAEDLRTMDGGGPGGHDEWLASWFGRPDPLIQQRSRQDLDSLLAQCPPAEGDGHLADLGPGAGRVALLQVCEGCYTRLGLGVVRAAAFDSARTSRGIGTCDVCGAKPEKGKG